MAVKNFDFGKVIEYDALTTTFTDNVIPFTTTCNQIAVVNETDGRVDIKRDGEVYDALGAGKSRSYVNWGAFDSISLKYTGTQPTEGFVSIQASRAPYGG